MDASLVIGASIALFVVSSVVTATLDAIRAKDEEKLAATKAAKRTSREAQDEVVDRVPRGSKRMSRADFAPDSAMASTGMPDRPVRAVRARPDDEPEYVAQVPLDFNLADFREDRGQSLADAS